MAVRYRFVEPGDADALGDVHTRSWQAAYDGLIDDHALAALDPAVRAESFRPFLTPESQKERNATWIVAEVDGEIVGHAVSQIEDGVGWLHILYVAPEGWGRGIGHTLHAMALRGLRRHGALTARLHVLAGNAGPTDFYERHGWKLTGKRHDDKWAGIAVTALEMTIDLDVELLQANRSYWDEQAPGYAAAQSWSPDIDWGIFGVTDEQAGNIFPDVTGLDVIEIGCGTGYVSNWAIQRGARHVIGLDNSPQQLATATQRIAESGVDLPLVLGDGHQLPFTADSFDVAINEYGAAIWCDPHIWIPEAARVLRPGGLLWFLGNSVQVMLCMPEFEEELASNTMVRPQRNMHTFRWIDTDNIEFHVSHGEMISILTGAGFVIQALHELYASPDAKNRHGIASAEWAQQWPIEEVWVAQLRNGELPT